MREIIDYYESRYREDLRLDKEAGPLEFARTQDILSRRVSSASADVMDLGGGPGRYAEWLTGLGHKVTVLDLAPGHVRHARETAGIERVLIGDARALPFRGSCADVALLLGPLYHLVEPADRARTLAETRRILRPGGLLFAAAISRFASLLDGIFTAAIDDPLFREIVTQDLATGRHRSSPEKPEYFTTAYFHTPDELASEVANAGFDEVEVIAVEGPLWIARDFAERWADPDRRRILLHFARTVEREPALLGTSLHMLAIGRRADS